MGIRMGCRVPEMERGIPESEVTASTDWQESDEGDKLKAAYSIQAIAAYFIPRSIRNMGLQ